jgi:hypothetical protein
VAVIAANACPSRLISSWPWRLDRRAEVAGGPDPLDSFGQLADRAQHPARGQPSQYRRAYRADRHERDEQPAERRLSRCRIRRRPGDPDQHSGLPRKLHGVDAVDDVSEGLVVEIRLGFPGRHLDVVSGDTDEPVRKADRGAGQDLQLRAAERDQLPDGAGLLELRRYGLRVRGHLHERGVVLSAQVRADRRVDYRRHGRQRDEDDRADSDRDPGAQAHVSSRST